MKTILLKLSGPMQSYGTGSHFETRKTDFYPSKSAIIGLIAGCIGYRRDKTEKIKPLNTLDFGVRIDQTGTLLRDYHTAQKFKQNGDFERTYVTNRYYIQDAIYIVAIGSENDALIEEIFDALQAPYFQPFLGRKSLPVNADFILGIEDASVLDCLKDTEWQASPWYRKKHQGLLSIYVDAKLLEESENRLRKDRVESFSQKNRQFSFRYEKHLNIQPPISNDISDNEHDIFGAIGG